MSGHYHKFESDLRDALVAAGFIEQRLQPDVERYILRTKTRLFSAVPWGRRDFGYDKPCIWLAEVNSHSDVYADCADDIAAFVNRFNATAP